MLKLGLPSFSRKKLIIIGFLLVLLIGIPITVFLVQQQQQTKSGATKATTLSLVPSTKTANVGDTVTLDMSLDPGVNQVNFVKFVIKYDPTKLKPSDTSFTVNSASNLSILAGPTASNGTISVTLSVGAAFQNAIQSPTTIGTLSFQALASTDGTPTPVTFDDTQTQVRSLGSSDTATENVALPGKPAQITINGTTSPTPTPTATPSGSLTCTIAANPTSVGVSGTSTLTPTCQGTPATYTWTSTCGTLASQTTATNTFTAPASVPSGSTCNVSVNICDSANNCSNPSTSITITAAATPTPTPTAAPTTAPTGAPTAAPTAAPTNPPSQNIANAAPICQSFTLDRANSGTAPYTLNFTLTGADNDGTISKSTFNFGDGTVQDSTAGSGSNSISTQLSHTYNTAGTYTASATITDNTGAVSSSTSCTQTITISSALAQGPTPAATPTVLPSTGPDKTIFGIGALGAALSVIGVILFLAL